MNQPDIIKVSSWLGIKPCGPRTSTGWLPYHCPLAEWNHSSGKDSEPSFFIKINPEGISGFNCFTCKEHGRMSKLIRTIRRNLVEDGRLEEAADLQGLDIEADLLECVEDFGDYELEEQEDEGPAVLNPSIYVQMYPLAWEERASREYLLKRRIGADTARVLGLLYDPDEHRILFPVKSRSGELFGFEGRSIYEAKTKRVPKMRVYAGMKKDKVLLGEHLVTNKLPLFVVEGLFATARVVEVGGRELVNPIAPLTSRISKSQRDRIAAMNRLTYLCFDDDKAGNEGLFGMWNSQREEYAGGGAIDLLHGHVPVALPRWPAELDDIDNLTLPQLRRMVESEFDLY